MGTNLIDQYSLLHFATGIVAYFWGLNLYQWFYIHLLFELIENTNTGMYIINIYFKDIWPGGKPTSDSFINSIGDTIFSILGWVLADYISAKYSRSGAVLPVYTFDYKLYDKHIK